MGKTIKELAKTPLEKLTENEIKQITLRGLQDPVFFCKYFLSDLFSGRMPWLHRGILAILTKKTEFLHLYGELDKIVENFVYERDGELHHIFHWEGKKLVMELNRFTLLMLPRGFSKTVAHSFVWRGVCAGRRSLRRLQHRLL